VRSFPTLRAISALILREMATAHGRTRGGYLWAVVEPVAAVALLVLVFSVAFEQPPLGRSFALFYASGYLPFMIYSDLAQKIGVALRFSKPLLAYPAVTWWDALCARFVLNTLTHVVILVLVLGAIFLAEPRAPRPDIPQVLNGVGLAAALGFGLGALNAYLFEAMPAWERIWAIANRPLFILSGVLFLPDAVPAPYHDWLLYNPLVHVIGALRMGIYPSYDAAWVDAGFVLQVAAMALIPALVLLRTYARDLLMQG
jgi:capsular polysaccharide transport system permease protein